jgi:hypothetical protein
MRVNLAEEIKLIAKRVDRNVPSHRDPEDFHSQKSQISEDLKAIAKKLEGADVV